MKIIDGTNATLGRLASHVAKLTLKGEEVAVINCENVIMTGSKKVILAKFAERKTKIGSGQRGPKHSGNVEKVVKRAIRGMLPNARIRGRGKDAFEKIKCYKGVPKEFENAEKETFEKSSKVKQNKMGELFR